MNFLRVTWDNVDKLCKGISDSILCNRDYRIDCIIALSRGGLIPSRILADMLDISDNYYFMDIQSYHGIAEQGDVVIKHYQGDIAHKHVLIIDDIYDSGRTMDKVKKYFEDKHANTIDEATLFIKDHQIENPNRPKFFGHVAFKDEWVVFPWEQYETERLKPGEKTWITLP